MAQAAFGQGVALPVLTQARQIRDLTPDQAVLGYPIHLKAVVTFHDPERTVLYIQDETAGIYVQNTENVPAMAPGQRVEVDGFSGPGAFVPVVRRLFEDRFGGEKLAGGGEFVSVAEGLALIGQPA